MNYDVEVVVDFVKREKAIHEPVIVDITFSSTDKKLIRELAVRQFLLAYDMTEDYAAKIFCYMYDKRVLIEGREESIIEGIKRLQMRLIYPIRRCRKSFKNYIAGCYF